MTSQSNGPLPGPIRLRDGTTVLLRPIEPTDGPALVRFHEGLSDLTSHRRFFNVHPHLSAAEVVRVVGMIRSLPKEMTILMIEHDMKVVFSVADRITVLYYGEVLATGTPADIQANARVREVYLGVAH